MLTFSARRQNCSGRVAKTSGKCRAHAPFIRNWKSHFRPRFRLNASSFLKLPSATTDSVVQPHPSRLQPVQLQEASNAARATPQLTLSAEVLATLTNSISAEVSEALLTVA